MSHPEISIIGGGWSAKNVDLASLPGTIIAVNDAAFHSPRVDIVLSMDRLWLENRWHGLERTKPPTFVRLSAMRNMFKNIRKPWVFPFDCRHDTAEFGDYACMLNGPNSGHCALNLAYVMKPARINLVGFDMGRGPTGEAYWFEPYPWVSSVGATSNKRYGEWAAHLDRGIRQCEAAGIAVVRLGS